jgi:hypothetical protein
MDNISQNLINTVPVVYAQTSNAALSNASAYALQIQNSIYYYQAKTPAPFTEASGYTYDMNISAFASPQSTFLVPMSMFLYHDRGAFMADVSGVRNEIAYHYKKDTSALSTDSSMTINFRAYSKQTYYVIFRSDLLSFQNTSFKIFTWFPTDPVLQDISYNLVGFDPYANPLSNLTNSLYAQVNDRDFIQLPTDSNLMGLDPSSDVFNSNIPIPEALIGSAQRGTQPAHESSQASIPPAPTLERSSRRRQKSRQYHLPPDTWRGELTLGQTRRIRPAQRPQNKDQH